MEAVLGCLDWEGGNRGGEIICGLGCRRTRYKPEKLCHLILLTKRRNPFIPDAAAMEEVASGSAAPVLLLQMTSQPDPPISRVLHVEHLPFFIDPLKLFGHSSTTFPESLLLASRLSPLSLPFLASSIVDNTITNAISSCAHPVNNQLPLF